MARKRRKIKDQSLNELRELDAGKYKGPQWAGQKIPTLLEVLQTVPKQKSVFIEIKCGQEIFPALETDIEQSHLSLMQVKLIGFDFETMVMAKSRFPTCEVLLNAEVHNARAMPDLIARIQKYGLDGINLGLAEWIDKSLIDKIKQQQMKIYIWVVNDPEKAGPLLKAGVHGIMTDRPQWLRTELLKRSF
jgi:glycerophosphoryl diester phosphodiesterase